MSHMMEASAVDGPHRNSSQPKGDYIRYTCPPKPLSKSLVDAGTYVRKKKIQRKAEKISCTQNTDVYCELPDIFKGKLIRCPAKKMECPRPKPKLVFSNDRFCQTEDSSRVIVFTKPGGISVRSQTIPGVVTPKMQTKLLNVPEKDNKITDSLFGVYDIAHEKTWFDRKYRSNQDSDRQASLFLLPPIDEDLSQANSSCLANQRGNMSTYTATSERISTTCKVQVDMSITSPAISTSTYTQYSKTETTASFPIRRGSNVGIAPVILISTAGIKPRNADKYTSCTSQREESEQKNQTICLNTDSSTIYQSNTDVSRCFPSQEVMPRQISAPSTKGRVAETLDILRDIIDTHPFMDSVGESTSMTLNASSNLNDVSTSIAEELIVRQNKIVNALNFVRCVINTHPWLEPTHDVVQVYQTNNRSHPMDADGNIPARHSTGCGTYKKFDRTKAFLIPCSKVKNCPKDCHEATDTELLVNMELPEQLYLDSPNTSDSNIQASNCRACQWSKRLTRNEVVPYENPKNGYEQKITEETAQCGILVRRIPEKNEEKHDQPEHHQGRLSNQSTDFVNGSLDSETSSNRSSSSHESEPPHALLNRESVEQLPKYGRIVKQISKRKINRVTSRQVATKVKNSKLPRWTAKHTISPILVSPEIFNTWTPLEDASSDFGSGVQRRLRRNVDSIKKNLMDDSRHTIEKRFTFTENIADTSVLVNDLKSEEQTALPISKQIKRDSLIQKFTKVTAFQQSSHVPNATLVQEPIMQLTLEISQNTKPLSNRVHSKIPVYVRPTNKSDPNMEANNRLVKSGSMIDVQGDCTLSTDQSVSRSNSCINFSLSPACAVRLRIGAFRDGSTVGVQVRPSQQSMCTQKITSIVNMPPGGVVATDKPGRELNRLSSQRTEASRQSIDKLETRTNAE